jgi:uncharacterized DUF497 family protein
MALTFDPDHSFPGEEREVTIGLSHRRRLMVVTHCKRGRNIRFINARQATWREGQHGNTAPED